MSTDLCLPWIIIFPLNWMFYENNSEPNLTIKGKWKPFLVIWESVLIQNEMGFLNLNETHKWWLDFVMLIAYSHEIFFYLNKCEMHISPFVLPPDFKAHFGMCIK